MGWIHDSEGTGWDGGPDTYEYTLKETFLRDLVPGEVRVSLDSDCLPPETLKVSKAGDWTSSPSHLYRVWKEGRELAHPYPEEIGEVVSTRALLRDGAPVSVPMEPGIVLAPDVCLFRRGCWDYSVVLPSGRRLLVGYNKPLSFGMPLPLSLVEAMYHEHSLTLSPCGAERRAFGSLYKSIEVEGRRGPRRLALVTKALDLDGRIRLYLKTKVAFDVTTTRRHLADLAVQEGWCYAPDSYFAQYLRGERTDAGDQDGPYAGRWARGGETVFGYTGDEIRLP